MANSDNRPAFRLPWQGAGEAPGEGDAAAATAVAVSPDSPAWPSHDLARRSNRAGDAAGESARVVEKAPAPDAIDPTPGASPGAMDPASAATGPTVEATGPAVAAPDVEVSATEPSTEGDAASVADGEAAIASAASAMLDAAADLASKRTKFRADLTRAMRAAADEARDSVLAQFRVDVDRHMEAARGAAEQAGVTTRQHADDDITALGEWETAEMARIRAATESGITARQDRLETELADQTKRLSDELTVVQQQVERFQAEMDAFFERLQREDDPAMLAGLAEQLPDPPAFSEWTAQRRAARQEAGGRHGRRAGSAEASAAAAGSGSEAPELADDGEASAADDEAGATAGRDPGMPLMQPGDFAAAEAEAADWVAVDQAAPEGVADADPAPAPEGDGSGSDAWPPSTVPATTQPAATRTQVAVVGLVSVASIATFKRMLARAPGVRAVQVASGPDGEFLFSATHEETIDMAAVVAGIQGFQVEVVESSPGIVSARAVDPEVV